ncbi:MAG: hypothetical protein QOE90_1109 [Thermoplasmata archaeon]|nr:hypothetical protein [Thermoplasmata archaeon]
MQPMVDTLLVNETLRHMDAEARAPGAYSNAHLERMAIRKMFGEDGLASPTRCADAGGEPRGCFTASVAAAQDSPPWLRPVSAAASLAAITPRRQHAACWRLGVMAAREAPHGR